jgi:hypothetical protein
MNRREFIRLVGAAAGWPIAAWAQQPRRMGVLLIGDATDPELQNRSRALEAGLRDLGWIDGGNLRINYRWAPDASSVRTKAAELVAARPELIVATSTPALAAAQQATSTIPIVFNSVTDPVAQGFIASLGRPGGNSTGFGHWQSAMGGKWLEVLKETAPELTHVAVVFNPDTAPYSGLFLPTMEAAIAVTLTVSPNPRHRRDGARPCGSRSAARRRSDAAAGCLHPFDPETDRGSGGPLSPARDLPVRAYREGRRLGGLWNRPSRCLPPNGDLRGPYPQRRETG